MRIVFMGTPDLADASLQKLLDERFEVVGVFTQPDKPKGRGMELQASPVKQIAAQAGIPVFQPEKMRDGTALRQIQSLEPDILVVVAYGRILPDDILAVPRYGAINVHGSLLPKYRGASPIQWAVLSGEKESGVTIMRMDEGIDTGDIIAQEAIPLSPEETAGTLFEKLAALGARLLCETLPSIENGTAIYTKQNDREATRTGKIEKEMGRINWKKSAEELERWVRGMSPFPSAFTYLDGRLLKVWKAEAIEKKAEGLPGTAVSERDALLVATGKGTLRIKELQLAGKKRMDAGAFLRGCPVADGTVLG